MPSEFLLSFPNFPSFSSCSSRPDNNSLTTLPMPVTTIKAITDYDGNEETTTTPPISFPFCDLEYIEICESLNQLCQINKVKRNQLIIKIIMGEWNKAYKVIIYWMSCSIALHNIINYTLIQNLNAEKTMMYWWQKINKITILMPYYKVLF